MINDIFQLVGFKEEEVKTYLFLLDRGACPAGDLAKHIKIPRPTLYGYLDRLVQGGLVSVSQKSGVKIYIPEPGDKIRRLYKRKIEELKDKEKSLDTILPALEKHAGATFLRPKMQFFEG